MLLDHQKGSSYVLYIWKKNDDDINNNNLYKARDQNKRKQKSKIENLWQDCFLIHDSRFTLQVYIKEALLRM